LEEQQLKQDYVDS